MDEKNDTYLTPGCRSFTNIQIVEHTHNKNRLMKVPHNIYLNDVILHSATHLITYLNEVFENIIYPFMFGLGPHTYNHKIFENDVLERHDFDIYFSQEIGEMLGMNSFP